MSEQVGSVTRKKSSDFHGGIRFQSSFTIRWELEDKNFLKIDIICLDDSLKYRIMAIKTNENFTPFSNSVTFRKHRETDLVTASELVTGFCRSKSNVPTPGSLCTTGRLFQAQIPSPCLHFLPPPREIYIDMCIIHRGCTSIDFKLLIDSAYLLASLGDKGLFSSANFLQIADVVRRELSSCCLCFVFSQTFAYTVLVKRAKKFRHFVSLPKQLNLVSSFSRSTVQQSGNFATRLISSVSSKFGQQ